ncbi:hypothetical protein [Mucilaginibacter pedocola]|uniref:Uncharacterized protein n=1 Tax=Mucilaginibacter pedocola TaxID=1792845 RepID=A0A1S9PBQ8_9SPHI|nr:hypothetical protein [Mucilaginibacter pedocola]OOQ58048.1 hypothetical protein BC343_10320 [Mucilaginibacter pedocola]
MPTLKPKLIFAIALLALTTVGGCKKGAAVGPKDNSDNVWLLNNIKHTVTGTNRTGTPGEPETSIVFQESYIGNSAVIDFTFKTLPTASGTYRLIYHDLTPLGDDEMNLVVNTRDTNSCQYIGEPVNVQVTVTNGKIKIDVPPVKVKSYDESQAVYDLSASVYEL